MKTTVIINEQHTLLPEQSNILFNYDPDYEILLVPANGWSRDEMEEIMNTLDGDVIFVSPIPYMINNLAFSAGVNTCLNSREPEYPYADDGDYKSMKVKVFCNDKREKKELPNGKIISVTAKDGWYLA